MKKIVLFINSLGGGGAEHQLVELANGLTERGYDVSIISWADLPDYYNYNPKIKRTILAKGKSNVIKIMAIWRFFLTVKADCVIGFGQRENRFSLAPLMLRRKIKAIAGERSITLGKPTFKVKIMLNILYRRADYIVPNSYTQRSFIISQKPIFEKKTITIINYTDTTIYSPTKLPCRDFLRIAVFGRYDMAKNRMRFVDAVKKLHGQTDKKFTIDWFGNHYNKGEQINPFYVEMKNKVEEYGLQDVLHLNDLVKDVAGTMSQFDAFCLPSLWEGFSNAIGEAICCGKPCLVSNVSDNGVMVKEGENGYLFNPRDEDAIVTAFLKFLNLKKEEREEMGYKSRKRAEELFDRDRYITAYERLINH